MIPMEDIRTTRPSRADRFFFQIEPMIVTIIKPATIRSVEFNKSRFRLKVLNGSSVVDEMQNAQLA